METRKGTEWRAEPPTSPYRRNSKITFDLPSRVRDSQDEGEDVTAPKTKRGRLMKQSFVSMIASVGLNASINRAFGVEDAALGEGGVLDAVEDESLSGHVKSPKHVESTTIWDNNGESKASPSFTSKSHSISRSNTPSEQRQRESIDDNMLMSQILTPPSASVKPQTAESESTNPYVSEENELGIRPATAEETEAVRKDYQETQTKLYNFSKDLSLSQRLAKMFSLERAEGILSEYSCTLLGDVTVDGNLYLTAKHLLFYAYIPNEATTVSKSGYLFKRGRQNPRYKRYWVVLKRGVLSYYSDRTEQYFPRGTIDLRSGVSAIMNKQKPTDAKNTSFRVETTLSTYHFKADSVESAQEWVEKIQKVNFKAQNKGDSFKISMPLENILEIEVKPLIEATYMVKVKVVDHGDEEAYAVDEYFFTFCRSAPKSLQTLLDAAEGRTIRSDHNGDQLEDVALDPPNQVDPGSQADPKSLEHRGTDTLLTDSFQANPSSVSLHALDSTASGVQQVPTSSGLLRPFDSFSSVQDLYRVGANRLRQASHLAGMVRSRSWRVRQYLATESKGYYEKVHTMWAGKKQHYNEEEGPVYEHVAERDSDGHGKNHGDRFREHFALHPSEKLRATYYSHLQRALPVYGKIYVGTTKLCYRSLVPGTRTRMILPFRDIENIVKEKGFRFGYHGLVIVVRGYEELFFEFSESVARDDCAIMLLTIIDSVKQLQNSNTLSQEQVSDVQAAREEHDLLQKARHRKLDPDLEVLHEVSNSDSDNVIFDDTTASIVEFTPSKPLNITCLTIGSRGDVQPYIALCQGLIAEGHRPTIATHPEFEEWIRSYGIDFKRVAGNPAEIMQLCVENDMFTISFLREANKKFRGWIDDLLVSSLAACKGADVLIESPSCMGGIHIAEAMGIPYFRAFTMPWTHTRAYPHAFLVTNSKMGGNWNWYTYVCFNSGFWACIQSQVNRWRRKHLRLPPTTQSIMQQDKTPFLYNFSPCVVPRPLDFAHQIHITGYWFLDEGVNYTPAEDLLRFIEEARNDNKKLVYVGFGSVTVENPAALTQAVAEAVTDADVRCILCKGWSDRLDNVNASEPEIPLHDDIFQIPGVPHDWLFNQVDAVAHHGGAGTTGASLRAGKPTIVKPFFGDQHFFASRVEDLGVGRHLKNINSRSLAQAFNQVTQDERMIERARSLGEQIKRENGVEKAIQTLYRDLEYAKTLIKRRPLKSDSTEAESEESWTLVDEDFGSLETKGPEFQSSLSQSGRSYADTGNRASAGSSRASSDNDES